MASHKQAAGDDSLVSTVPDAPAGATSPPQQHEPLPHAEQHPQDASTAVDGSIDMTQQHDTTAGEAEAASDAARSTTPPPPHPAAAPAPVPASATRDSAPHAAQPQPQQQPASQSNPQHHAVADSSFLDRTDFDGKANDTFNDQHYVNDTLPEIESSFIAPLSPLATITRDGPDDTYLFDSPRKHSPPPLTLLQQAQNQVQNQVQNQSQSQNESHSDAVPASEHSLASSGSSLHTGGATPSDHAQADADVDPNDSSFWSSNDQKPNQHNQSTNSNSTTQIHLQGESRRSINFADSVDSSGGNSSGGALRYGKRPRFLRSRNASARSSASSFMSNPDANDDVDSDVTVGLGLDYATRSGAAIPTRGARQSSDFFRTVSIGSVGTNFGGDSSHSSGQNISGSHGLEPPGNDELLRTPRAKAAMAPPTDTVLTRRVMDVQVPESLAKEYRTKNGMSTPRKHNDFNSTMGTTTNTNAASGTGTISGSTSQRPGRNMTLKEQSSTIERLSKENFDLKLKVMFLSDRLDKLSEDGVKEMIQENVEFRTNIAILQRDNKALRRRVKELEKRARDDEEQQQQNQQRPGTSRSVNSIDGGDGHDNAESQEREEEVMYLRERVEEYETLVEQLRQDLFNVESDKRRMGDLMKDKSTNENLGRQEEEDVWKDLLEQETARREHADEENRKLRDEIFRLKQDYHIGSPTANGPGSGSGATHHTTNFYSIRKGGNSVNSPSSRGMSSNTANDHESLGLTSGTNTLVEELRREGEQLRHENAELRKEVGAQTSMLTSRNREKERLYQEIEDLKMAQRRHGGPAPSTIDSLLDRSASQIGARDRSASRASGGTRAETIVVDDQEREEMENLMAGLRDKINEAKLENQTLMQELDATLVAKQEAEEVALSVQKDYEGAMSDLMAMQSERDDLIAELNDLEQRHVALQGEFEDLRVEAQEAIDGYEEEADIRDAEAQKMQAEIAERTENFNALQEEMRKVSEALVGLEDETENKVRRVQQLEEELGDANKELEELEAKLLESNDKAQRLLVQQENSQGEIAFLREEQESDKINISRLEVNVNKAEEQLRDEQERVKQLQAQIVEERERSESLATNDKKEMQQIVNELSREASVAKEESRKLRKSLTSREVEATEWKERLMELENNLREALGDLSGTRSSLLKSIAKLQRELENTVRELDETKALVMEKDRIIKQRDALLESHGLEARKMAEALDKERAALRHTRNQFETFQKTHQHVSRTVSTQDARINELESSKNMDKKRMSQLELTFKDQLTERNNLLLLLWTRLSAICGTDWSHDNSLINGRALPSLEVVATMLPGFTRNLMAAIKHIETVVGGFPARIKSLERDLWREYQTLETGLDARVKKLDRLEAVVRNGLSTGAFVTGNDVVQTRMMRIEEAYRQLKVENATLRAASDVRARAAYASSPERRNHSSNHSNHSTHSGDVGLGIDNDQMLALAGGSPSPSIPTGPRDRSTKAAALRARSSGRSSVPRPVTALTGSPSNSNLGMSGGSGSRPMTALTSVDHDDDSNSHSHGSQSADPRWILRLRDLENKLKMEREGRTMDRNEAGRRLREQEAELLRRAEREKRMHE